MSNDATEQPHDDGHKTGHAGEPDDEQLPGRRDGGPDPEPVSAEEDDGTGSVSGAG